MSGAAAAQPAMHSTPPGSMPPGAGASANPVLADLRSLLAERFQGALSSMESAPGAAPLPTGWPEWDAQTGGLRSAEITEICGSLAGTHLVVESLLESCTRAGWLGAWVDAGDSLEVADWAPRHLQRLLWVRCRTALSALKAADLLVRDGNCTWVVLDLQGLASPALRGVCGTHWHRFHRLLSTQRATLVVLSRNPLVEGVRVRIASAQSWPLNALEYPRTELRRTATIQVFVRGRSPYRLPPPRETDIPSCQSA